MNIYGDLTIEEYFALLDEICEELVCGIRLRIAKMKADVAQEYSDIDDWEGFDN